MAVATGVPEARESEVSDQHVVVGVEEEVRRLDVVMEQPEVMDAGDPDACLLRPPGGAVDSDAHVGHDGVRAAAVVHDLGDDERRTGLVVGVQDGEDEVPAQAGQHLRFEPSAYRSGAASVHQLERYPLLLLLVPDFVDVAVLAATEVAVNPVPVVDSAPKRGVPGQDVDGHIFHKVGEGRALGLHVDVATQMRPVVRVVLLKDPFGAAQVPALGDVTVETEFDLTLPDDDWAELADGYFRAVSGRVSTLRPDIVIVRRADMPARPSNKDGPRLRLVVEGAVTAAAHETVANTHLRTGVACAHAYNRSSKAALDADATGLVQRKQPRSGGGRCVVWPGRQAGLEGAVRARWCRTPARWEG